MSFFVGREELVKARETWRVNTIHYTQCHQELCEAIAARLGYKGKLALAYYEDKTGTCWIRTLCGHQQARIKLVLPSTSEPRKAKVWLASRSKASMAFFKKNFAGFCIEYVDSPEQLNHH